MFKENLENLTKDDAFAIAVKLMDIIVKINDWSEKNQTQFKPDQTENLKNLSFELSNRFLHSINFIILFFRPLKNLNIDLKKKSSSWFGICG